MKNVLMGVIGLLIILAALFGYGNNIYLLFTAESLTGMETARGIGIVAAPLGAILGYF